MRVGGGDGAGSRPKEWSHDEVEWFCDGCDRSIATGRPRYECALCHNEFCFCDKCFRDADITHLHNLIPNMGPTHITLQVEY